MRAVDVDKLLKKRGYKPTSTYELKDRHVILTKNDRVFCMENSAVVTRELNGVVWETNRLLDVSQIVDALLMEVF